MRSIYFVMRLFILVGLSIGCQKKDNKKSGDNDKTEGKITAAGTLELDTYSEESKPNVAMVIDANGGAEPVMHEQELGTAGQLALEIPSPSEDALRLDESGALESIYLMITAQLPDGVESTAELDDLSLDEKISLVQTFRYVGLPSERGKMIGIPADSVKDDLELGQLAAGEGEEVDAELKATTDIFDLSEATIESFAVSDDSLKLVKNRFLNKNSSPKPNYVWTITGKTVAEGGKFTSADSLSYKGYGLSAPGFEDLNIDAICASDESQRALVELVPEGETEVTDYGPISPSSPYTNMNMTLFTDVKDGKKECSSAKNFYVGEASDGTVGFNFGQGKILGAMLPGMWVLRYEGKKVAAFEFATASPLDADGNPIVFVPALKVVLEAGKISRVDMKYYEWNNSSDTFEPLEDTDVLDRLTRAHTLHVASTDFSFSGPEDGVYSIDGSSKSDDGSKLLSSIDVAALQWYLVAYEIGQTVFHFSFE